MAENKLDFTKITLIREGKRNECEVSARHGQKHCKSFSLWTKMNLKKVQASEDEPA